MHIYPSMILHANEYRRVDASSSQCGYYLLPAACRAWIVHAFERISSRTMVSVLRCSDLYNVRYDFTSAQLGKAAAWQRRRRWWRLFIVPAMVANSSCATDPQAYLPMLYLCLLYSRFRCRRGCLNVHTYRDVAWHRASRAHLRKLY